MSGSSGEKTEQPTDKKIRDARKKGQVAKSTDVSSTAILIIMFTYLGTMKGFIVDRCTQLISLPSLFYAHPFEEALGQVLRGTAVNFIVLTIPMLGIVAFTGIFINMVQVGPLLTFEPLKPEFKKLNPIEGVKKIFSKKNFMEFLKSVIKVVFLGYLIYRVVKWAITPLLKIPFAGLGAVFEILGPIMKIFAINVVLAYIVVAVLDFIYQRSKHTKDLMMTKDEVKREYKEMEGDPQIKGQRKQLHQELAMNDTVQSTKKASALVTNPTHYAVAIFYDEDAVKLPVVIAKGKDHLAQLMIKTAEEEGIPIMRDVALARQLHAEVETWNYVPTDLITPVAAVLKWAADLYEGR